MQQTPAPPGYPLYIGLGKLFYLFFHDPHKSILVVSILASMCGAVILYLIGKNMYNRFVGIIATAIFLTGSTFYYFGLTAYPYGILPIIDTVLAFIVYEIFIKKKQLGIVFGFILGICFGIRPQEVLFIGQLALLGFIFLSNKQKLYALVFFSFVTILWLIPVSSLVGGLHNFLSIMYFTAKGDIITYSLLHNTELMIKGFLLSFGVSSIFLLYYIVVVLKKKQLPGFKIIFFYGLWIIPGVYFNLFYRTEHAGYQMSYLSAFLILIAYAVWRATKKSKTLLIVTLFCIVLFNLYWFFYNRDPHYVKPYRPTSFHYSDIRKNDLKTGNKVTFVEKMFDTKKTLIITTDTLWRPYMYYLKQYSITVLPGLDTNDDKLKYGRVDSLNWDMHSSVDREQTVIVPNGITHIVFMDDAANTWIKNYLSKKVVLPGNSAITIIQVQPGDTIFYGYHQIRIKK